MRQVKKKLLKYHKYVAVRLSKNTEQYNGRDSIIHMVCQLDCWGKIPFYNRTCLSHENLIFPRQLNFHLVFSKAHSSLLCAFGLFDTLFRKVPLAHSHEYWLLHIVVFCLIIFHIPFKILLNSKMAKGRTIGLYFFEVLATDTLVWIIESQ